jgi:hypothetical protein
MNDDKLYGLQVDFLKLNDQFLYRSKQLLSDRYRINIESLSIEANPNKQFVLKHKNQSIIIPIEKYDDDYKEVNEALKNIIRTMMDKFPEDFI